jgi:tyrosinase
MGYFSQFASPSSCSKVSTQVTCTNPVIRREWRSLTNRERADYVRAVNCLSTIPSRMGLNGTLYDDFTEVHRNVGMYCMCF